MNKLEECGYAALDALEAAGCYAKADDGDLSKCMVDGGLFDMRDVIRDVLVALREPDEGMLDAMNTARGGRQSVNQASLETFQSAIDAALDNKA